MVVVGTKFGDTYLNAIDQNPHWELAGIVAKSENSLKIAAKKHNLEEKWCFKHLETALDKIPEVDAVAITTPNNLHYSMARNVIDRKLHIALEKPITETWEDAVDLVHRLDTHPTQKSMVGQTLRGEMMFRLTEYAINSGMIGKIEQILCRSHWWWVDDPQRSWRFTLNNMFLEDIAIHQIEACRMFAGNRKALEVMCQTSTPVSYPLQHIKTTVSGYWKMEDQIDVDFYGSMAARGERTSWHGIYTIFGEKGCIVLDGKQEPYAILEGESKKIGLDTTFGEKLDELLPYTEYNHIAYLLEDFYHAILDDRPAVCDLHQNLGTFAIMKAMEKSAVERRVIDVPKEYVV